MTCVWHHPSLVTAVRVNLSVKSLAEATVVLQKIFSEDYVDMSAPCPIVTSFPRIPDVLIARGSGPHPVEPVAKQIYVDNSCGMAVLRGSHIFAPGIVGSNGPLYLGDKVAVYMMDSSFKNNGDDPKVFLGNGRMIHSQNDTFLHNFTIRPKSEAVKLTEPVWNVPTLERVIDDWGLVQSLPSIMSSHLLDPKPEETVLDMCGSGGHSLHIASLMGDRGRIVAMDKGPGRAVQIHRLAITQRLKSIELHPFYDATLAVDCSKLPGSSFVRPPYPPASFDRILLNAPSSCFPQRPNIQPLLSPKQLKKVETNQSRLLDTGIQLLKSGGTLVYSTTTLRKEETDDQLNNLLKRHSGVALLDRQLFDPSDSCPYQLPSGESCQKNCWQKSCRFSDLTQLWLSASPISSGIECLTVSETPYFLAKLVKR